MASKPVTKVDIEITVSEVSNGALQIMKHVRPNWKQEDIRFQDFTDGITNTLIGCYVGNNKTADMVLVRVYGQKTELFIDREEEKQNIQILHAAGCAPELYCMFNNGISYGFVPGQVLDVDSVRKKSIQRLIAREMAKMHHISAHTVNSFIQDPSKRIVGAPEASLFKRLQKYMEFIPTEFTDVKKQARFVNEVRCKEKLLAEMNELRQHLEPLQSPVVFCHNDLLCKNIIYNDKEEKITFVDYEYGAFNFQAHDIGNHFCEYAGVDEVDYAFYPDRDTQWTFLHEYLKCCMELNGQDGSKVTNSQIQRLYVQTNKFALASNLFWGVWALIQARYSAIEFDFLNYAIVRFNEYFARKDEFLSLHVPDDVTNGTAQL